MLQDNHIIKKLTNWAMEKDSVRAMILRGSRANPNAYTDNLSDYDIELYVKNARQFLNDEWMNFLGNAMIRWPLKPMPTFDKQWITRLVLFENKVRIDFQITSKKSIDSSAYEDGYKVLVDKDRLTINLAEHAFSKTNIKKPGKEEFEELLNAFFWDATYIAKSLKRDELYYAKFMLDNILRFGSLQKIIEWHIAMRYDWHVSTGKCGRFFKDYIDAKTWTELENTFSDAEIENNWQAFFKMVNLFRRLSKDLADNFGYNYPFETDKKVTGYCKRIKISKLTKKRSSLIKNSGRFPV